MTKEGRPARVAQGRKLAKAARPIVTQQPTPPIDDPDLDWRVESCPYCGNHTAVQVDYDLTPTFRRRRPTEWAITREFECQECQATYHDPMHEYEIPDEEQTRYAAKHAAAVERELGHLNAAAGQKAPAAAGITPTALADQDQDCPTVVPRDHFLSPEPVETPPTSAARRPE